jgi:peptidoglycan biosynthesis protein MviN/MurJ (putative lipid II flippase)
LIAATNGATAIVNIALSIALIGPFGLPGVAIGTLIPVAIGTTCVLFPAACRRVELSVWAAARGAVWPAAWPGAVYGVLLWATRPLVAPDLLPTIGHLVIGGLLYQLLFFGFAISRDERAFYRVKARQLAGRYRLAAA